MTDKNYITEATELFADVFGCDESELVYPGAASPIEKIAVFASRIASEATRAERERCAAVLQTNIDEAAGCQSAFEQGVAQERKRARELAKSPFVALCAVRRDVSISLSSKMLKDINFSIDCLRILIRTTPAK